VQEDSVDPLFLMRAALAAARNLGVEIRGHTTVTKICAQDKAIDVVTETDTFTATALVDCRGAWSGAPVRPRKGQILYVQPRAAVLQHVLRAPDVYLVPRSTGKVLVGATVEDTGYDKSVNPATIHSLLSAAAKYLPELSSAPITQSWAGLRPGTPDDLPILGSTVTSSTFVASGHFRNGILLAPITAKIMAGLVQGRPSPLDIGAFTPSRFHSALK
jgi:glycine oxidase